jgi:subtilase family serine protease
MKKTFLAYLRCLAIFMVMLTLNIHATLDKTFDLSSVRLSGHVPSKVVNNAVVLEHLDAEISIPMTFVLPLRNQKALEELIQKMYDPSDKQHYANYLTSEEFIKMFAPTQEDYDKVIAYAKKLGMHITGTHPNRILLNVSGTTKSIEEGLKLNLHLYQHKTVGNFTLPAMNRKSLRPSLQPFMGSWVLITML